MRSLYTFETKPESSIMETKNRKTPTVTVAFMDCINMLENDKKGMAASSNIIHPRIQIWYIGLTAGHK